jgi:hypothetical protein
MTLMRWLGTAIYHVSPLAEGVRDNFRHVLGPEGVPRPTAELL